MSFQGNSYIQGITLGGGGGGMTLIKGYRLYDATYIAFLKWQDFRNEGQINGCQGLGNWEGNGYNKEQERDPGGNGIIQCLDCGEDMSTYNK